MQQMLWKLKLWVCVPIRAPKTMTDKLQCVLNAAAHVVSGTWKFDRGLSAVRHSELHWLDIPEWIIYKLGAMTYGCQHRKAPQYVADCCTRVSDILLDSVYGPPVIIILSSYDNSLAHMADGLFLSLVRLSGTLYRSSSVIRTLA